jgi:hypothetical protein
VNKFGITGFELTCVHNHTDIIELLTDKVNRMCIVCSKITKIEVHVVI